MSEQCKSPEKLGADVSKSHLKDADKQVAKGLLDDVSWFKLPSRDIGQRCVPAQQMLDEYQFRGGREAGQFAQMLGLPESSAHRPRDISNIILETNPETKDHTVKAEIALKSGNPNLKDKNILGIWLPKNESAGFSPERATLHKPEERNEVAQMHSYMESVNRDFERAAELSKMVKADGGKPPTVITPMLINPYHMPLAGVQEEKNPFVITPGELGINPITPENKGDIRHRDEIMTGLKKLADKGDYRAQSVLDSVAAIEKLANTGSKVYISQSNENKFELTGYLASFHPNVATVTSLDRHGDQAYYNKDSGAYAKEKGKGTLVGVPADLQGKLDMSDMTNAIVYKSPADNPLAGAELLRVSMGDEQFNNFTSEVKRATDVRHLSDVYEMLDLGRSQLKHEGEMEPFVLSNLKSNWNAVRQVAEKAGEQSLPAMDDDAGKEAYLRSVMNDRSRIEKLGRAGDDLIEAKLKEDNRELPTKSRFTGKDIGADDKHFQLTEAILNWDSDLDNTAKTHVFTPEQYAKLMAAVSSSGKVPPFDATDNKLYYTPDDLTMRHPNTYLAARTNDGRTVVLPTDSGNSFAAPYAAGFDESKPVLGK